MAQSVEIPGRGVAEFPDEMLPDEIKGVIKKKFFQQPTPTPVPTTPGSSPVAVQERVPESPSAVAVESPKAAIPEGPWLDQPIVQAATIPQQESIIAQTGAGLYNSLARGTEALLTPRNVIMAPALAVKPFARLAEILFGSHALHDVPEAVKAGFAPGTTFQQGIESGGRAITDILFGTVMARGAVKGTFGEPGKISDIAPETTAVGEAAAPERPPVQPEPVLPVQRPPEVEPQFRAEPILERENIVPDTATPGAIAPTVGQLNPGDAFQYKEGGKVFYAMAKSDKAGKNIRIIDDAGTEQTIPQDTRVIKQGAKPLAQEQPAAARAEGPESSLIRAVGESVDQLRSEVSNVRYGEPGQILFEFKGDTYRAPEPADVMPAVDAKGTNAGASRAWALRQVLDEKAAKVAPRTEPGEPVAPEPAAGAGVTTRNENGVPVDSQGNQRPELMTPEEVISELGRYHSSQEGKRFLQINPTQRDFLNPERIRSQHKFGINQALQKGEPVNVSAIDAYGMDLPKGYIRQGDVYALQPAEAPKVTSIKNAAVAAEQALRTSDLPREAQGAIQAASRSDKPGLGDSQWTKETVSIESLKPGNEMLFEEGSAFQPRAAQTKGPVVIDSKGEIVDGNNRVFEARNRGDKTIEVFREQKSAQAEQAGLEAAGRVEDFIPSDQALRSTAFGRGLAAEDTLSVPKTELRSSDAKVESRWKDATRTERSLFQKAKDAAISIKNEFTRADPYLDPKTDAPLIDTIRRFRTIPRHSQELAANIIRGFTAGLGKNKFEVYQRNVILNDLARDVEAGRYAGRELPFGYTPETLKADTVKFQELAKANPLVEQSLATRNKFMDTLKTELVENDLLPEQVLQEGDYFHRQVVDYLNAKDSFTTGIGTKDVRVGKKGFQRERTFSSKDYNTKYIEAEYEVISQALSQLRTKKTLAELKGSDIKPQLMEEAKAQGVNWEELIPDDHAIWQPKEGNVFYSTMTIPEKVIDGIFKGDRQLSKSDLREVLAMGGAREQWVVPKRLAKTLDNISPKTKDSFIDRMAQNITNGWKVWTLLNPVRSVKYGLNNLSGDLDISMAYSPKISAQYGPKAAKDMHRYVLKRGAMTPEVSEGIEKGVLSSGFSVTEVPDISSHQFFRAVTGEKPSLIDRFWQKNKDYHNWRENVLRLASWRFFKDKLANAKPGERFYAASRKSEIDGLYDAGVPSDQIAAKLARELIGDYGNISHAGQYIRTHAVPFYSWMEINAPRYVRLLKNAASEGEGNVAARAAGVIAKRTAFKAIGKTVKTGGLAAGMYTLVNLWNHTRFPQEEAELGEARRDLHLILGRNEDGSIKTLRVQGALSDALSFFGAEDLPSDIQDVATGKATIGEKAIEAVKAAPTKYISGVTPFVKTPVEALSKQSLFPDPFNPRPIRDSTEAIARMFSLDKPYQYFADKPMRPVMTEIANLVTYTTEPGEAAYHMTRGLVSKWQTKQGGEKSSIIPTKRQNALFYYKKATQLGETEKAERWKQRYMDMGGKEEGLAKSVAVSSPLGGLSQKRRTDFLNSLNPKEREIVDRADDWYTEIYGNTSTRKFKGF